MTTRVHSWFEAGARQRIAGLLDPGSFVEFCPPSQRLTSPHLELLDAPVAFDDGVVVGAGELAGATVLVAAQEGRFNGGAVGEVHGAKIRGLLECALRSPPVAVLLLIDSGGVRLHEANAGLIAISEIVRALFAVRAAGVPTLALVGGSCGAFGGMGIVARLSDRVIMSDRGRLGLSGPEVIETVKGADEFDARDRALVWRVTGGKLRRALGEADRLVGDDVAAFRAATLQELAGGSVLGRVDTLEALELAQSRLARRAGEFAGARDGREVWRARGFPAADQVTMLGVAEFERQLSLPAEAGLAAPPGAQAGTDAVDTAWAALFDRLFGTGAHSVAVDGAWLGGSARLGTAELAVIGTRAQAAIDSALALKLSAAVLDTVRRHRDGAAVPVVLIADTQGQALSRHEELLGLNGYFAHLARCVDLARRRGHPLVTLIHGAAVSGGFLSFGMMADRICALPDAEVRVMDLRAMARVTRIALERLQALAADSPVFAPGAQNFLRMGGVHEIWAPEDDWQQRLAEAIAQAGGADDRAELGRRRGGRRLAREVADRVMDE